MATFPPLPSAFQFTAWTYDGTSIKGFHVESWLSNSKGIQSRHFPIKNEYKHLISLRTRTTTPSTAEVLECSTTTTGAMRDLWRPLGRFSKVSEIKWKIFQGEVTEKPKIKENIYGETLSFDHLNFPPESTRHLMEGLPLASLPRLTDR